MANQLSDIGMIGLGVMGRKLLLNMADHGFKVIGYKSEEKVGKLEADAIPGTVVKGVNTLQDLIKMLVRRILRNLGVCRTRQLFLLSFLGRLGRFDL